MTDWVYDFNLVQWLVLGTLIGYIILWISGVSFMKDPEKRLVRIEILDDWYLSEFGFVLFQIRNLLIWLVILIVFLIIT
jgi:hypothetical protein